MQAFWAKGYEATSLVDLVAATGLLKGSLYQAFGDKHSLFLLALNRYLAEMRRRKNECLAQATSPLEGIKNIMHRMIDMADSDSECPKGCMAMNSLAELVPHDPEVRRVMDEHMSHMRASVAKTVSRAQAAGEIGSERPAEEITLLLMTFMAGLATTMKGPLNKQQAHKLLDMQLESIT
jgi:TetR/AcrR family transcriptional repressor of nem operon